MNDAPFLVVFVAASVVAVAAALIVQRGMRGAAARHSLLLTAVLLPPVLLAAGAAGLRLSLPSHSAAGTVDATFGLVTTPEGSHLPMVLGAIWFAGLALALVRISVEARRWRGVAARGEIVRDPAILRRFDARHVLARSSEVSEPMAIGILDPVVVLPAAFDLEPAELDAVFAHELAHLERRDNLTALMVQLVCAAFWFDPIHRVARRTLLELRERVCDDLVLERGCDAAAYATALARSCSPSFHTPAAACMSRLNLHERMESIMTHETRRRWPAWIRRTLLTAAVAAVAIAFGTFAPAPSTAAGEAKTEGKANRTRPRPIHRVDAVYTEEAKTNHIEGDCIVETTVDRAGVVTDTRIVKALPYGLDQAAAAAIRQWRFEPATADGKPVAATFTVTMRFKLDSN